MVSKVTVAAGVEEEAAEAVSDSDMAGFGLSVVVSVFWQATKPSSRDEERTTMAGENR